MLKRTLVLSVFLFLSLSCKQNEAPSIPSKSTSASKEQVKQSQEPKVLFSWLDNLNVRENPSLEAKIIAKVNPKDSLVKTGRLSDGRDIIVLRGLAYKDYWYEVETPEQKTVWVFGGAVKSYNEEKGNPPNSALKFNFPSFGAYNLHNWKRVSEEISNNADATFNTSTYQHPSEQRKMVITKTDLGEYGYSINHELLGVNDKPILSRTVHFDNEKKTLTEEVITHNMYPKRKATRTQEIGVSYLELNGRPILTQGEWRFEAIE